MGKFTLLIDNFKTASQIADLLNANNNLKITHTFHSVLSSFSEYFVLHGVLKHEVGVVGCVGVKRVDTNFSIIQHLCVHKDYRKKGLADQLLLNAVNSVTSSYAYMTIRDTNTPCLQLANKHGFQSFKVERIHDYNIITVGKQLR